MGFEIIKILTLILLLCHLQVDGSDSKERVIVFFKIRPEAITPDNTLSNIIVSSMVDSPLNTLYHAVQKVSNHSMELHRTRNVIKKQTTKQHQQ